MRCGVEGRFEREGIYVYLRLVHIVVQQKPAQRCKAIIFQLKVNYKKKNLVSSVRTLVKIFIECLKH